MTLTNLQADLYRRLGFQTAPDSAVVTRLLAFLNETQQEVLSEPGMESLLTNTDPVGFASVASQQQYSLGGVVSIKELWETTNDRRLNPMSVSTYRSLYPDPSAITGIPDWWVDFGLSGLNTDFTAAARPFVLSTSASDGAGTTAYIEGFRAGVPFTDSVAMNGVTEVGFTNLTATEITKFYISVAAVGTVSLRQGTGGTTRASIGVGQTMTRYHRLALVPTPSGAVTYTYEYQRFVADLINANDEPVLPASFHRLLVIGARAKEYERRESPLLSMAQAELRRGIKALKHHVATTMSGSPNLRNTAASVDRPRQRLTAW